MKRILLSLLVVGVLLLAACGSSQEYTPFPSPTTPTTTTPTTTTPTTTTPPPTTTTTPTQIPEPEPIVFNGQGDDVSSKFTLESGITIITMTHDGESNFAIELLDNTGGYVDLLVNEIGVFDGSKAIGVSEDNWIGARPGMHILSITADGNWTVTTSQ